ncbi:MAG: SpoIIE family protein phosphatase [Victivallaceae bacterium]|nr:SpoIIE family protein phosphatase [Victivallaceae bacterium]
MPGDTPFVELEYCQLTHDGECACGDDFQWALADGGNRHIAVLSDGLGSGIKAHLLANMTTTMALEFMKSNKPILRSAEIIMDSLPVCEVRKISYATFTIVDMLSATGRARVIEMGNPSYIQLRGEMEIPSFSRRELVSERWPDRKMDISELQMLTGDRLIFCSDGVTQAGLGTGVYKFGWRRSGCLAFARELIAREPAISAKDLSRAIAFNAMSLNKEHKCVDDISCVVLYFRKPRVLRILTGPPFHKEDDSAFAALAADGADRVIICGGTTANIITRELHTRVELDLKMVKVSGSLPPPGKMANVGLVTEGILTLTRVTTDLERHNWDDSPVAAREILAAIEESDVIELVVGTKVNEAHQDPKLPIDLEIRRNIIRRLQTVLENDYRKKVTLTYF